ncbi:hypothetical protein [Mycetocola spongiae]|uniref:hypothetical protein n=1 Tax=Mycetocola spongiae TaxID=2859226 RepID=UPI001CF41E75|nr:hypothetical protein [Mycetocola spongiae]UCR89984.1 hypothetical protein KXZ72_04785 [Mycetocola spongiae]
MNLNARRLIRSTISGALLLSVLGLAACAPEEPTPEPEKPATVINTPTQIWKDGITPSGPLEDDEWVQAVRRYEIGTALAWNTGDFTISQLTSVVEYPEDISRPYAQQGNAPYVYLAPRPFVVISSEPSPGAEPPSSGRRVTICAAPQIDWILPAVPFDRASPRLGNDNSGIFRAVLRTYTVGKLDNGNYDVSGGGGDKCDATGAAIGYFDPAPTLPKTPVTKPVRQPFTETLTPRPTP